MLHVLAVGLHALRIIMMGLSGALMLVAFLKNTESVMYYHAAALRYLALTRSGTPPNIAGQDSEYLEKLGKAQVVDVVRNRFMWRMIVSVIVTFALHFILG